MEKGNDEHRATLLPLLKGPGMEVTVCSGEETAKWSIPKALLSHHSEFFRAACNGPFREGIENKITLQNCHPKAFEVFVQWLYFGVIPSQLQYWDGVWGTFHLWILGDRFLVPDFKNTAMRDLYDIYSPNYESGLIEPEEIEYCWKYSTAKSTLRYFILDSISSNWERHYQTHEESAWIELFKKIPDFRNDLLFRLGSGCTEFRVEDYLEKTSKTAHDEHEAEGVREAIL